MTRDRGFDRSQRAVSDQQAAQRKLARRGLGRETARTPHRNLVFSLDLDALRILLEADDQETLEPEGEAVPEDTLLSDDSEVEAGDEDAFEEPEVRDDKAWTSAVVAEPTNPGAESETLLKLSRYYTLVVFPAVLDGTLRCAFEAPRWMMRPVARDLQPHVARLVSFLRTLASWIEGHCQAFLRNPTPATFAEAQGSFRDTPVVLQEGLLERVNEGLPEAMRVAKADFTRLLPKIWLVWPHVSMPLRSLFSDEFRSEWAASGALLRASPDEWHVRKPPSLEKEQGDALMKKDFANLTQEERLYYLSRRARTKVDHTVKVIRRRLSQAGPETGSGCKPIRKSNQDV